MSKGELIPPDGGYGWVIVCASAITNFVVIPLIQGFGLIFKDTFRDLGFSATQVSFIINLNCSLGMLLGLLNGPLLKCFGYRKISFLGGGLITLGVFLTTFANSFAGFILTYGIIASLGLGLTLSSYSLAVNTYFKEKKSKAIGLSMTITGLGPIVMPQIINLLIQYHTIPGVTLILSALCAHNFVAASLLQPVKWHMKRLPIEESQPLHSEEEKIGKPRKTREPTELEIQESNYDISEQEHAGIYGLDTSMGGSMASLNYAGRNRSQSLSGQITNANWWKSESTINLQSSVQIFDETKKNHDKNLNYDESINKVYNPEMSVKTDKKSAWKRFFLWAVKMFDLQLLTDLTYVNIMVGMSLAVFAEINFSVLTVFILSDFGLNTGQIATFLSVLGVSDIIFRFLAPYIGDLCKQPPRIMYMFTLLSLITGRFGILISKDYHFLLAIAVILGCAKGIRTVYMSLVIPTYVSLELLPSASGIQMMVNGFCILVGGPIIGLIRDVTGDYTICLIVMNIVTFTTIIIWSTEMIYKKCKKRKEPNEQKNQFSI